MLFCAGGLWVEDVDSCRSMATSSAWKQGWGCEARSIPEQQLTLQLFPLARDRGPISCGDTGGSRIQGWVPPGSNLQVRIWGH